MRCPYCQTVNPLNAKFCYECGNRFLICPNCGTANLPMAKFCIECGTQLQPRAQQEAQGSQTRPILPLHPVHEVIAAQSSLQRPTQGLTPEFLLPPEERRVVTVMFADIIGSTPLADRLDPEDMRAILTGYFNLMAEQIRKHGGTVEKYIGDAVMAVFGAPLAHEDDPDRALRAALDMQTALTSFNEQRKAQDPEATRLQMRIGINSGEVATPADISRRQDFLITGDAVNIAARLQQIATPDTILVGERTYLSTREVFSFLPIAPLHLKGKPEPIVAYVVQGLRRNTPTITQHPRGLDGRQVPLVGRSLELTLIHASYARVQAERHPHLITILGVPGVGKTRLVKEFIARERDTIKNASARSKLVEPLVLQGRCPPYGEGITYWPLIEILRALLQVKEDETDQELQRRFIEYVRQILHHAKRTEVAEDIASTIIRSIGRELSGRMQGRERNQPQLQRGTVSLKQSGTQVVLLQAWRVFLEALAESQPLIVVIDDLHAADDALLDLLEYLTEKITNVPILFLCPARPDFFERRREWGGGQRNFTTIELDALSEEETSELVDELLNTSEFPEILRLTILTRAEGNPFFVEEIVRMLIDQGILIKGQENGSEVWRPDRVNETFLGDLNTPGERPDDTLINMHYVLPMPRLPDTIQGVLTARVDLLKPVEKLILQHAAIIGRSFWLSSLRELATGMDATTVLNAVYSLIERDFITETERQLRSPVENDRAYSFKHVLIRDVVYSNIPRARRSQEHARLALWLEEKTITNRDTYIELLAYHYQQALLNWSTSFSSLNAVEINDPDHPATPMRLTRAELRQRAIIYLTLAGDQALHSYYTTRAIRAYNDAFELLADNGNDNDAIIKMHEKMGDAYAQRGSVDEAWQEYCKALSLTTETGTAEDCTCLLPLYERLADLTTRWAGFYIRPDPQEVRGYIDAGLRLSGREQLSREQAVFHAYLSLWYAHEFKIAPPDDERSNLVKQALISGQEALRLAEEVQHPAALSMALDTLGLVYRISNKYRDALEIQQRRLKLEPLLQSREELFDLYDMLGVAYEQVSDYPTALMWFGRSWSNAQTMESPRLLLLSMEGRMHTWERWERWENARQVAHEILQIAEQYQQDPKQRLWPLETLTVIAYRQGNREEGDDYARQYKRLLEQVVTRPDEALRTSLATGLHAIHLACEEWQHALKDYQEKLRLAEPLPSPTVLATLAELLVITGEEKESQASMCERAILQAEASGNRKSMTVALRARGRMYMEQEQWKLALDDLRQSLQRCEVLDLPWERGNTLYQMGMLYRQRANAEMRNGRRSADLNRARYHFEQALGFFESLKALPSVQRTRLALMQDTPIKA